MHLKPKKSLGQNFLIDRNILRKIVSYCGLKSSDTVLEIGAGMGELTGLIAACAGKVYAVEIDRSLFSDLKDALKEYKNIKLINRDILKVNLSKHFARIDKKIKVVGNIPYYITTPIIERLLRLREKIDAVFLTVQKEFAERIAAQPGSKDYGSFSCFVQYYADPKILFTIKKTCFFPRPKVDSCFLRLGIREKPLVRIKNEKLLFKIIRAAFNKRRKTLRNSLKGIIPAGKLTAFFNRHNINPDTRPEDLALQDFADLANSCCQRVTRVFSKRVLRLENTRGRTRCLNNKKIIKKS